jgi:hypothetical protein
MDTKKQKPFTRVTVPATGWSDGLLQDYNRALFQWFASRIDARECMRQAFAKDVTTVDRIRS